MGGMFRIHLTGTRAGLSQHNQLIAGQIWNPGVDAFLDAASSSTSWRWRRPSQCGVMRGEHVKRGMRGIGEIPIYQIRRVHDVAFVRRDSDSAVGPQSGTCALVSIPICRDL